MRQNFSTISFALWQFRASVSQKESCANDFSRTLVRGDVFPSPSRLRFRLAPLRPSTPLLPSPFVPFPSFSHPGVVSFPSSARRIRSTISSMCSTRSLPLLLLLFSSFLAPLPPRERVLVSFPLAAAAFPTAVNQITPRENAAKPTIRAKSQGVPGVPNDPQSHLGFVSYCESNDDQEISLEFRFSMTFPRNTKRKIEYPIAHHGYLIIFYELVRKQKYPKKTIKSINLYRDTVSFLLHGIL